MGRIDHYSTEELERHVCEVFQKLKAATSEDGVYRGLSTVFHTVSAGGNDGEYCYSDQGVYRYRFLERGKIEEDRETNDITEITYWAVDTQVFEMSLEYEFRHRVHGQDSRRLMFSKNLEYFAELGEEYLKRAEQDIAETLEKAPYEDELYK